MTATTFAIVGAGWRAEFFRRLGAQFPDELELVGGAVRRPEAATSVSQLWGVPIKLTTEELLQSAHPDFVVTCVPWAANPALVVDLVHAGAKVLSETPPAPDLDSLRALWADVGARGSVQVAEQYHLMPGHAARAEILRRDVIGTPTQVQMSSTHTYHAISLIRSMLGIHCEPTRVSAAALRAPLVDPLTRDGWTEDTGEKDAVTTIAILDFGDGRSGLYDFTTNQWHNQLRHRRIVIRGSRGEIADDDIVHARDPHTIVHSPIVRQQFGHDLNLDGFETELLTFEGVPVWRNPFLGHRYMDEEIAIAQLLLNTARWATDAGPAPYALGQACQDHRLGLAIDESLAAGRPIDVAREAWATQDRR